MKNLALICFLIFGLCSISFGQKQNEKEKVIDVSFCDLLKNPGEYKDKIIRVSAIYSFGFEVSKLYCSDCEKNEPVWVEFSIKLGSNIPKNFRKNFREENYGVGKTLKVTLVGKYNFNGGFGHMGVYPNQFTVLTVENAETVLNYGGINYQALPEKAKRKVRCGNESKQN